VATRTCSRGELCSMTCTRSSRVSSVRTSISTVCLHTGRCQAFTPTLIPKSRSGTLRSYVDAYLREEVQAEALVRDIGGYARLLDRIEALPIDDFLAELPS
jgi:hypothetical protein